MAYNQNEAGYWSEIARLVRESAGGSPTNHNATITGWMAETVSALGGTPSGNRLSMLRQIVDLILVQTGVAALPYNQTEAGMLAEWARALNGGVEVNADDMSPLYAAIISLGPAGGGPTPPTPTLRNVATECYMMTRKTASVNVRAKKRHKARSEIVNPSLVLGNWFTQQFVDSNTTYLETNVGGASTQSWSIEYPDGVYNQVTVGGLSSFVIADGATIVTDPVMGLTIPDDATFYTRCHVACAQGVALTGPTPNFTATVHGEALDAGASLSNNTMGGAYNAAPSAIGNCHAPLAILAMSTAPSVYILGDSKARGTEDTLLMTSVEDRGTIAQSLGPTTAYGNYGNGGDSAYRFMLGGTNYAKRANLFQYHTHFVCTYLINDLGINARSSAQALADLQSIWDMADAAGLEVYQSTTEPVTTSTDNWATTANQTVRPYEANIVACNDAIRALPAPLTGYFDIADAIMSARNSGKWKVTGSAFGYTPDGLHPNAAGYLLIKNSGVVAL